MSASPSTAAYKVEHDAQRGESGMYVTMRIGGQLFGIPVAHVRDVLRQQKVTAIPLAPAEVAGSLNLRGRIVTVIDLRRRLNLPPREANAKTSFVVVELKGELYSLMVDSVGEVLSVFAARTEPPPANLTGRWKEVSSGIYKLESELLVLIDVQALLTL